MSKEFTDGVWIAVCDWEDPDSKEKCILGKEGEPAQFIDPTGGSNPDSHYQCGRHHDILPQEERPEFALPEGHKLKTETLSNGSRVIEEEEENE